jgi:hypothetical protein
MRLHQWISARVGKGIVLVLGLAFAGALIAFVNEDSNSRVAAEAKAKIEATIFTYDGQDFVRTKTTLVTKEGEVRRQYKTRARQSGV